MSTQITMSPRDAVARVLRMRLADGLDYLGEHDLIVRVAGRHRVIVDDLLNHMRRSPVLRVPSSPVARPPARRPTAAGEQVSTVGKTKRPAPVEWPARGDRPGITCTVMTARGQRDGGRWYWRARLRQAGARVARCPGWATRAEAHAFVEAWAAQLDVAAAAGGDYLPPCSAHMTVAELLGEWLRYREPTRKWSPATVESKASVARGLTARLGRVRVADVNGALVARYMVRRLRDVSPGTLNNDLDVLGPALAWAASAGLVPGYEAPAIERIDYEPARSATVPAADEVAALISWLDEHHPFAGRAARFLAETGARIRELWRLHWHETEQDANGVWWVSLTGKGKTRRIPLSDAARDALLAFRPAPDAAGFTAAPRGRVVGALRWRAFTGRVREPMAEWRAETGGTIWPHDLRAWMAARLLDAGVDADTYEKLMGHSFAVARAHYLRHRPMDAGVAAVQRLNAAAAATTPLRRREGER